METCFPVLPWQETTCQLLATSTIGWWIQQNLPGVRSYGSIDVHTTLSNRSIPIVLRAFDHCYIAVDTVETLCAWTLALII